MATCDICGNEFRNNSGLSGHKQLAHRLESAYPSADGSALSALRSASPSASERFTERSTERSADRWEALLETLNMIHTDIAALAESVEELVKPHGTHGMVDPHCADCNGVVRESLAVAFKQGADERDRYYESVPGVKGLAENYEVLKAAIESDEKYLAVVSS